MKMSLEGLDIHNTPALAPPDGVEPNFVDPPTAEPYMIAAAAFCLTLAFAGISIRFYTKAWILKSLTHDDCTLRIPSMFNFKTYDADDNSHPRARRSLFLFSCHLLRVLADFEFRCFSPLLQASCWQHRSMGKGNINGILQ
jgi:hypothetical protein